MSVIQTNPITQRDRGPYRSDRQCKRCAAYLSSYNPSHVCAPCRGPVARAQAEALVKELMEQTPA